MWQLRVLDAVVHHGEMPSRAAATLVLWDIDRTLVDVGEVSRQIYQAAFSAMGAELRIFPDLPGHTERSILEKVLNLNKIDSSSEMVAAYRQALGIAARRLQPEFARIGHSLPGAAEAIDAVGLDGAIQTVVTGNFRPIALIKLEAFNLATKIDVEIGGYADNEMHRAPLIRSACRRASVKYGRNFSGSQSVVIGDTEFDILAACEVGIRSVGVASGRTSAKDLKAAGADVVLTDLTDTDSVVSAVLGGK